MLTLTIGSGRGPSVADSRYLVNTWCDDSGHVCGRGFADGRRRWIQWAGVGTFGFARGSREVEVWPEFGVTELLVRQSFARMLQPLIMQALGWQALHASAVANRSETIALCGRSGSGKSTLAYALRHLSLSQVADDGVVVALEGNRVRVHTLPFAPRLRPAPRDYFAARSWSRMTQPTDSARLRLKAVFILSQDAMLASPPRLDLVPATQSFAALLTHAHCFDTTSRADTRHLIEDYLEIAEHVEVFMVRYRPGLDRLSELTRAIMRTAGIDGDAARSTIFSGGDEPRLAS